MQRRLITHNPCHIRGAGNVKRAKQIEPASLPQLEALAPAMPERYRLRVLLAAWCGRRFGEITELRRHDVDLAHGVVKIRRAVVRVDGTFVIGTPKSDAGTRDVAIPPHLLPAVKTHLASTITGAATDCSSRPPVDPTSGSTTFATPERSWPPAPAPHWPN
ncbi:hypothetical protein KG112_15135 [Nocardioides sp. zg-ZUI104]|uniref:hypothetical protein n=1 Tax=Nocardioides faecalis TaxID=2803858 RepID=UPI001BCF8E69|nr:hypothetical protein [Nocardioides faecalis]MBS4754142.1 hypothetical protein [Nocardioides faecalis]